MNSKTLFKDLISAIKLPESDEEIQSIAYLVMEKLFGLRKANILSEKDITLEHEIQNRIANIVERINKHEPVQYILGEANFYGRIFNVSPDVLIPRQETEELAHHIIRHATTLKSPRIVDIGTGSGCIPITLCLEIPGATVYATDISEGALSLAKKNAKQLGARVSFIHNDILQDEIPITHVDILVSNPPYITHHEKNDMNENVLRYEPHLALFVPENDPLCFYKAILARGQKVLNPNALVIFEINEHLGNEMRELMASYDLRPEIIKDLSGKDRIAKGILKN